MCLLRQLSCQHLGCWIESHDDIRANCVKTQKPLTSTHNFHINRDVADPYLKRKQGDSGLTLIFTIFEYRMTSLRQHHLCIRCRSAFRDQGCILEAYNTMRLGKQPVEQCSFSDNLRYTSKEVTRLYPMYHKMNMLVEYVSRKIRIDWNINDKNSLKWTNSRVINTHFDG